MVKDKKKLSLSRLAWHLSPTFLMEALKKVGAPSTLTEAKG
jgi:hypothetical protein